MDNITDILQEKADGILTEGTLKAIENAFNKKVGLHVEAALVKQDDEYSAKLEHLLEAIDVDHTGKLDKVVNAIDKNHGQKLINVVEKYSRAINEEAVTFKRDVVHKVSKYLDIYLEKLVPQRSINEAVKNRRSARVISQMRKVLAIDAALQRDSVKDAIIDGKIRIDESTNRVNESSAKLERLQKENALLKSRITLEERTNDLPEDKANFCKKVLSGKSAKFITENFDYTLKMFDKNHEEHLEVLHEQAKSQNTVTKDVDRPIIEERVQQPQEQYGDHKPLETYMGELGKY